MIFFFALSHGQHRGELKKGYVDERVEFINKLEISDIKKNFYGIDKQPIWGTDFFSELSKTKMGLNYNRGMPTKYYSSDRICLLIANGLLTFLQRGYSYEDFLEDRKDVIYYDDHNDLSDYIKFYSKNNNDRSKIALNGKEKYFKIFENTLVTKYMIEKILDYKISYKLSWMN